MGHISPPRSIICIQYTPDDKIYTVIPSFNRAFSPPYRPEKMARLPKKQLKNPLQCPPFSRTALTKARAIRRPTYQKTIKSASDPSRRKTLSGNFRKAFSMQILFSSVAAVHIQQILIPRRVLGYGVFRVVIGKHSFLHNRTAFVQFRFHGVVEISC